MTTQTQIEKPACCPQCRRLHKALMTCRGCGRATCHHRGPSGAPDGKTTCMDCRLNGKDKAVLS